MKIFMLSIFLLGTMVSAQLIIKPEDAIMAVYPEATSFEKKPLLLSEDEAKKVEALVQQKLSSKVYLYYKIKIEQERIAYAGLYTTHVRSKTATYLVFIEPDGKIKFIEVIAFNEPPEYIPKQRWLQLFKNKSITDNLTPKESIPNLSGATLSARSASDSAKLMLAIWQIKLKKGK